jgi:hypothetical protein
MCANNPHGRPKRKGSFFERWAGGLKSATYIFFTSDAPLSKKVIMVPKNVYRRAVQLSECCGNYGEPGC